MDGSALEPVLRDALWQTTAWLGAGLAASRLLARRPCRAHRILFLCVAAAVATPIVSLVFRVTGWGLLPGLRLMVPGMPGGPEAAGPDAGTGPVGAGPWALAAGGAWLVLTALATVRLLVSVKRGRRLLADAEPIEAGPVHDLARSAALRLQVRLPPTVWVSGRVRCPVIWCWGRRPRLVVPPRALSLEPAALLAVLCHELAHFRRRDHLASLGGELALCILPWHPLAWAANRRLRDLSEHACDAWVLACGQSPTAYADTLLQLAPQTRLVLAPAAANSRRVVAQRIRRILERCPCDPAPGSGWTAACVAATVLLAATGALAQRRAPVVVEPGALRPAAFESSDVVAVPDELDLGTAPPGATKSERLWIINRGAVPRRVLAVSTSCGCTRVDGFEPAALRPGELMSLEVAMTAPTEPGARKTKYVTFSIEGRPPLKVAVHLAAAALDP